MDPHAVIIVIACFFLKRDIVTGIIENWTFAICPGLGVVMVLALLLRVRPLLFACGVLEVFASVASWVGFIRWNVPWSAGYDPLAPISMALLDLISAVVLFHYSLTLMKDQQFVQLGVGE